MNFPEPMDVSERIAPLVLSFWELPKDETVWEWCEEHLQLLTCPTPHPGPYSTLMTPYVRDVLDTFKDPHVRDVTLLWGSQTGKTQTLMNGLAWLIKNDPGQTLWAFPNEDLASTFSDTRWRKMVYDSPTLAEEIPADPRKFAILLQPFRRMNLIFLGSHSTAKTKSNPGKYLIIDEADDLAEESSDDVNAIANLVQRTKSFWKVRKIFLSGTPKLPEGPVYTRYLAGDQRRVFVPCPHCGREILPVFNVSMSCLRPVGCEAELRWDQSARDSSGVWDMQRVKNSAYLECPHCHEHIEEAQKTQMVRRGEWQPTAKPVDDELRSFHLSSLYALDIPWGAIAVDFLRAKQELGFEGLRQIVTGYLAEPWQHQEDSLERREAVVKVSDGERLSGAVRIITADYQQVPPSWFVCREWAPGGDSRLVEWGTWTEFEELEEHRGRLGVAKDLTGCDSSYDLPEVHRQCARFGWFAMRGDDSEGWPHPRKTGKPVILPWKLKSWDAYRGTDKAASAPKISEITWSNPSIKDILSTLRNSTKSTVRWEVPESFATEQYFRHLDGEYKDRRVNPRTGKVSYVWCKRGRRWPNHLFDCECEQLAVAIYLNILKMRKEENDD